MLFELRDGDGMTRLSSSCDSWPIFEDRLGEHLGYCENISRPFDLLGTFGYPGHVTAGGVLTYLGHKPVKILSRYQESLGAWSTYLYNVRHMFTDWQFQSSSTEATTTEFPIHHQNMYGTVRPCITGSTLFRSPAAWYTNTVMPHYLFMLIGSAQLPVLVPRGQGYYSQFHPLASLAGHLETVRAWVAAGAFDTNSGGRFIGFSNLQYSMDEHGFVTKLSYDRMIENGNYARRIEAMKIEWIPVEYPHVAEFGRDYLISDFVSIYAKHYSVVLMDAIWTPGNDPGYTPSWHPTLTQDWGSFASVVTLPSKTYFAQEPGGITPSRIPDLLGCVNGGYVNSHSRSFEAFHRHSMEILPDCFAAVFFSSKEAVDKHFERMKSNHLEALLEVGDFLRILDLAKAVLTLRRSSGKSAQFLMKLLKLLADAKLTYSLGIAPTISDAKDVAKRSSAFLRKYSSSELFGENTIYGKFVYPIPDDFAGSFIGSVLTARSKLRMSVKSDSLLTGVLPVRSLGLLPSLSSIWDILPWSFVVDWALKVGDSLDDVETAAMLLCMECHTSVHSVSLTYGFKEIDTSEFNFSVESGTSGEEGAGYKLYDRFILPTVPLLGPTRLPFHGIATVPDFSLAASLVYQLVT